MCVFRGVDMDVVAPSARKRTSVDGTCCLTLDDKGGAKRQADWNWQPCELKLPNAKVGCITCKSGRIDRTRTEVQSRVVPPGRYPRHGSQGDKHLVPVVGRNTPQYRLDTVGDYMGVNPMHLENMRAWRPR